MQKRIDKIAMYSHCSYIRCEFIIFVLCPKVTSLTLIVTTSTAL